MLKFRVILSVLPSLLELGMHLLVSPLPFATCKNILLYYNCDITGTYVTKTIKLKEMCIHFLMHNLVKLEQVLFCYEQDWVDYTGVKSFYENDRSRGSGLMDPQNPISL